MSFLAGAYRYTPRIRNKSSSGKASWERIAAFCLIFFAVFFATLTYAVMAELIPVESNSGVIIWLLNLDIVILLLLVSLTANRIIALWSNRRKGVAGSKLQTRLVIIFCVLAAVPAIIMTVFSAYFFHYGVQTWFSERVRTAVTESRAVAEAYLNEHQAVIRADILAMAEDLNRNAEQLKANPQGFERYIKTQIQFRNFAEAVVFSKGQNIYAQTGAEGLPVNLSPEEVLKEAERGKVVLMTAPNENRVRALVELEGFEDSYLYVARMADPTVLSRVNLTRAAAEKYEDLQRSYSDLQIKSLLIFIVVAMVLLLSAAWAGLVLARQMTDPVTDLIEAAERVRSGDLTVRVPEYEGLDELDYLARGFNRMTDQIATQRDELISANRQMDHRRRFTEAILAGVSVGVIGVDSDGKITIANQPAIKLFSSEQNENNSDLIGFAIDKVVPGLSERIETAKEQPKRISQFEMPYVNSMGHKSNLLVRVAFEFVGDDDIRAVITFDDITELQSAQRKAAWSDVARRIAHEIKNPLTPIQLSAERLKRRYGEQIKDKPEIFEQCIETIIRQVGDIGRMVGEFSSFARMPEPDLAKENMEILVKDSLFLHQEANSEMALDIEIHPDLKQEDMMVLCDSSQVRQAITNLAQNAVDSVLEHHEKPSDAQICVWVTKEGNALNILVNDNGPGLPEGTNMAKLIEPYVTFKARGTGLGLAIVKKIMEDHKGQLIISPPYSIKLWDHHKLLSGAAIGLQFPIFSEQANDDVKRMKRKNKMPGSPNPANANIVSDI